MNSLLLPLLLLLMPLPLLTLPLRLRLRILLLSAIVLCAATDVGVWVDFVNTTKANIGDFGIKNTARSVDCAGTSLRIKSKKINIAHLLTEELYLKPLVVGGLDRVSKLFFHDLHGGGAKVQVMADARHSELAEEEFYKLHSGVKRADIVGIKSLAGKGERGEVGLSHCLHMMPRPKSGNAAADNVKKSKVRGPGKVRNSESCILKDQDTRYRQRYSGLMLNPEVRGIDYIKSFLEKHGFLKELYLKQLVVGGLDRVSKLFFHDLHGGGAKVQVMADARHSELAEEEFHKLHSGVKRADIVGIKGLAGKGERGEVGIFPKSFTILSHCLHMMPRPKSGNAADDNAKFILPKSKVRGPGKVRNSESCILKDQDTRYWQRYSELMLNPEVRGIDYIKSYLEKHGFLKAAAKNPRAQKFSAREGEGLDAKQYFQNRVKFLASLRELGVNPYPHNFHVSLSVPQYEAKYEILDSGACLEDAEYSLGGRIMCKRTSSSKLFFNDLHGGGAKVQVMADARHSDLAEEEFYKLHSGVKRGDIVVIEGFPGKSERGEVMKLTDTWLMLVQSLKSNARLLKPPLEC